ncbi:hypothetical protein COU20_00975 [Candidatus Kaiserbacteria bacterium CG10_big_fil_rev_8_21_14_0_10_59_10]|uniref:Rod shape-determining protein RodA n=1 Tax=Candidatus Kaiserbacteria bacterium CG10_big_fil_rev_8_21_14_0_10_59_10 TaxID=1974612 RepID=A0A2H0UAD4_9BACT|nr:MAG: hypothetical protein COU20_00975 [Candidatus Kaiserbacteria bacterium CG10_big_fil_rev_8_21_14_0_10_59_10]
MRRPQRAALAWFGHIDWPLFFSALALALVGLATMRPLFAAADVFFEKQAIWIAVAVAVFFLFSIPEYGFLRRTPVLVFLYTAAVGLLGAVLVIGGAVMGAERRFDLGFFSLQPADPAKLILIAVLAKYFARRHVAIAQFKHIAVSGAYALVICALVFFQPSFGGAIIIAAVWFGMVLVAGISWRHLGALMLVGALCFGALWGYVLEDYQKQRINTFIHPLADVQGAGYNAYQSTVAVGSGELMGKGLGYGTQSKLRFLPEYQTDFIFAAFAEEWGFIGVLLLFGLFAILILRILRIAWQGSDNFATLMALGVAILFISHFIVHVGMNIGLLPVTGTTIPFMSYGGSHLLTEFAALGILMGMRRRRKALPVRDQTELIAGM